MPCFNFYLYLTLKFNFNEMYNSYAVVNLSNLEFNYNQIRRKAKGSGVIAVVKADAYGHGAKEVSINLAGLATPPEYLAVARTEEGIELRQYLPDIPLLVFDSISENNIRYYQEFNLEGTLTDIRQLKVIKDSGLKQKLNVHVKVDTGMGRVGLFPDQVLKFFTEAEKIQNLRINGIYTHFATSDEKDKSYAHLQLENFDRVISSLKSHSVNYGSIHAANSGAILDLPESYFDYVRPGISLYGYYPSHETSESIPLKPVMNLISHISSSRFMKKGDSVSYSRRYILSEDANIISIPLGYADGINRRLTNRMKALIGGEVYDQAGTVTMDRIMFNTGNKKFNPGEKVILLGEDKNHRIDAWNWSDLLETIPYEITCGISKRVPRYYVR